MVLGAIEACSQIVSACGEEDERQATHPSVAKSWSSCSSAPTCSASGSSPLPNSLLLHSATRTLRSLCDSA